MRLLALAPRLVVALGASAVVSIVAVGARGRPASAATGPEVAPPPRPVVRCLATCYLDADIKYRLVENHESNTRQTGFAMARNDGSRLLTQTWAWHAARTRDNPSGTARMEQTTTFNLAVVCDYSPTCDAQNYGTCSIGTDETYAMSTRASVVEWNNAPRRGSGSNNQTATAATTLGVANPFIPGSYALASQRSETDGNWNRPAAPGVFDTLKAQCKLDFQLDRTRPVKFKCGLDFDPLEAINALFYKATAPRVEPREIVTAGAVPTIWTTLPVPPAFTAGVAAQTRMPITNERTGRIAVSSFAASHCAAGPCDWANVGRSPESSTSAQGGLYVTATKIRPAISVGDFACHIGATDRVRWLLPGVKVGPNGTPVFIDDAAAPPQEEGELGDDVDQPIADEPIADEPIADEPIADEPIGEPTALDDGGGLDLIEWLESIPTIDRSYEQYALDTQPTE